MRISAIEATGITRRAKEEKIEEEIIGLDEVCEKIKRAAERGLSRCVIDMTDWVECGHKETKLDNILRIMEYLKREGFGTIYVPINWLTVYWW